jgi:hypothetical protein
MKRSIIILSGFISLFWMTACDKLEAPYAVKKTGGDTTTGPVRKVLLEDYTGHKCVNCPEAAMTAHAIEAANEGRLIIIAVHAGFFSTPAATGDFTADYRTPAGTEWNDDFGINGWPAGLINRRPYEGTTVLYDFGQWGNAIAAQLALPQEANIVIDHDYNAATRELTATVRTKFLEPLSGTYSVTVCITEDSLSSPQKNNNELVGPVPIIYDYVFMDMLRTNLNGTWGEELTTTVDTSVTYIKSYSITLDTAWIAKHCRIVAFVANTGTKEVVQAEKHPVISE